MLGRGPRDGRVCLSLAGTSRARSDSCRPTHALSGHAGEPSLPFGGRVPLEVTGGMSGAPWEPGKDLGGSPSRGRALLLSRQAGTKGHKRRNPCSWGQAAESSWGLAPTLVQVSGTGRGRRMPFPARGVTPCPDGSLPPSCFLSFPRARTGAASGLPRPCVRGPLPSGWWRSPPAG